jgi:hypothetical protein
LRIAFLKREFIRWEARRTSTDTIWLITTAPPEQARAWLPERVAPDEILERFESLPSPVERYEMPPGHRAPGFWYD